MITNTSSPALDALAEYFDITKKAAHYEIRCKVCPKAWGVSLAQADNFNPLGLLDHAFMHAANK